MANPTTRCTSDTACTSSIDRCHCGTASHRSNNDSYSSYNDSRASNDYSYRSHIYASNN